MINFACVSNKAYISHALGLYRSARATHKVDEFTFHLYYVGQSPCQEFASLPNVQIYYDPIKLDNRRVLSKIEHDDEFLALFPPEKELLVSQEGCYCNNIRFRFARSLLYEKLDNILLVDADMLVNRAITHLPLITRTYDVALQPYCDIQSGRMQFCVEFLYIRNTSSAQSFFTLLDQKIVDEFGIFKWGHAKFFADQVYRYPIKWLSLPEEYRDCKHRETSFIWTGEDFRKDATLSASIGRSQYTQKLATFLNET